MAVWNSEKYLVEAIESVLNQTFRDFELIVINDGSIDNSSNILKKYADKDNRVVLVERENKGLTKSLNEGCRLAKGKYIARMDADDISIEDRLLKQYEFLERNADVVMVGSEVEIIDEQGLELGPRGTVLDSHNIRKRLLLGDGSTLTHPVIMARRDAMKKIGYYDEEFTTSQDLDLFLKITEVGSAVNLSETLLLYRQHKQSVNSTKNETWSKFKRLAVKNTIERIGAEQYANELFF